MLTAHQLIDLQVCALFSHDANSRLLRINEPSENGGLAPRFFFGRTRDGNIWRFRNELPEDLVEELERLCSSEPVTSALEDGPCHRGGYLKLLEDHAPVTEVRAGPAYCFTEFRMPAKQTVLLTKADAELLNGGFEDLIGELSTWQPFVALIKDEKAVSICRSVRITAQAHEAGVETLPEFRGRGYAGDVTAAWARLVRTTGAVPLYSTSWQNDASQGVARKLNLKKFGEDFSVY